MDVHIYRSEGKDPADVVRVEVRPREGVARRYDPLEFLDQDKVTARPSHGKEGMGLRS